MRVHCTFSKGVPDDLLVSSRNCKLLGTNWPHLWPAPGDSPGAARVRPPNICPGQVTSVRGTNRRREPLGYNARVAIGPALRTWVARKRTPAMTADGLTSIDATVPLELEPGDSVGEYIVLQKLGEGGFGAVYEAAHPIIGKRAAVKVLHSQYSTDEGGDVALRCRSSRRQSDPTPEYSRYFLVRRSRRRSSLLCDGATRGGSASTRIQNALVACQFKSAYGFICIRLPKPLRRHTRPG